jgi:hypothetical protein
MNTTINNNTVTINTKELLPVILRMMSPEQLAKYESTTPVLPDFIMDYNDLVDYSDYSIVRGAETTTAGIYFLVTDKITADGDTAANSATSYHENP